MVRGKKRGCTGGGGLRLCIGRGKKPRQSDSVKRDDDSHLILGVVDDKFLDQDVENY